MKRYFSLVLALVLALSCSLLPSASAAKTTKATECRSLVAFEEAYTNLLTLTKTFDKDLMTLREYAEQMPTKSGNDLVFRSSAGVVVVDPETFKVKQVSILYMSSINSYNDNQDCLDSGMMAVAALETDTTTSVSDAIGIGMDLFGKITNKISEKMNDAMKTRDDVYLCSYNYDYYMSYSKVTSTTFYVYVIAKARK